MTGLISVIIPIYNTEKYIRKCLDSVLEQTYSNLDIILIDDGSHDNSGVICDSYARKDIRVRVFHILNGGVSHARNLGIEKSYGDWITFIDADDYILPNHIETLVKATDERTDLIVSGFLYQTEQEKLITDNIVKGECNGLLSAQEALEDMGKGVAIWGFIWNKLFKKKIILENNLFFNPSIKIWEDMLFSAEYITTCSSIFVNDVPTYVYIRHENSAMTSKSYDLKKTKYEALLKFEELLNSLLLEKVVEKEGCFYRWVKTFIGSDSINDIVLQMKCGQYNYELVKKRLEKARECWDYLSAKNRLKYIMLSVCPGVMNVLLRGKKR